MTLQWISPERMLKMRDRMDEKYATAIRHGNHLWVATVAYFVQVPLSEGAQLDAENMAMDPAVGCYVCEQLYDKRTAERRCPGEPS